MEKGDTVMYNGEKWEVYFLYDSGYCEIKQLTRKKIRLVHQSEVVSTCTLKISS